MLDRKILNRMYECKSDEDIAKEFSNSVYEIVKMRHEWDILPQLLMLHNQRMEYWLEGMADSEIAEIEGCSSMSIQRWRYENNLQTYVYVRRRKDVENGLSLEELSEKWKVKRASVQQWIYNNTKEVIIYVGGKCDGCGTGDLEVIRVNKDSVKMMCIKCKQLYEDTNLNIKEFMEMCTVKRRVF